MTDSSNNFSFNQSVPASNRREEFTMEMNALPMGAILPSYKLPYACTAEQIAAILSFIASEHGITL